MSSQCLKTELACSEQLPKTVSVPLPHLTTAAHTPHLSSAVSDEILHPCLQGSVQLHAASLSSSSAIRCLFHHNYFSFRTGLIRPEETSCPGPNPKYPGAVRLLISLISYLKCHSISLLPLNQMVRQIGKAWFVLPSVPVHAFLW